MDDNIDKREAELLARLEAEREQRLAEKVASGDLLSVPIMVVAGSETEARAQVERAKAAKLAELRGAGDQREVVFNVVVVKTGVVRCGEIADPHTVPSAPSFALREDRPSRPTRVSTGADAPVDLPDEVVEEEDPPPPLIETYIAVQTRRCVDDDDPGEIAEGWFSVDGSTVTVTNKSGGYVGSRAILEGEDAKTVARRLLRDKQAPEEEFTRELRYPNAGLA